MHPELSILTNYILTSKISCNKDDGSPTRQGRRRAGDFGLGIGGGCDNDVDKGLQF